MCVQRVTIHNSGLSKPAACVAGVNRQERVGSENMRVPRQGVLAQSFRCIFQLISPSTFPSPITPAEHRLNLCTNSQFQHVGPLGNCEYNGKTIVLRIWTLTLQRTKACKLRGGHSSAVKTLAGGGGGGGGKIVRDWERITSFKTIGFAITFCGPIISQWFCQLVHCLALFADSWVTAKLNCAVRVLNPPELHYS